MRGVETIYGLHAVQSLLERHPERVRLVRIAERRDDARVRALLELAQRHGRAVQRVDAQTLERLLGDVAHQGVAADIEPLPPWTEDDLLTALQTAERPLILALDGVQDPHNLGACLRSAAAAGATAVVIPKDKAVQVTATVRKTSAGAADSVPVVRVTNLARCLAELQKLGVWIYGLAGEAETPFYSLDLRGHVALVLGGEAEGLRRLTREHCDRLASIPMPGLGNAQGVESLNVSVAAGVVLFEAVRQRMSG